MDGVWGRLMYKSVILEKLGILREPTGSTEYSLSER